MDGNVDLIVDQRALQLLGPEGLPPNIGKWPILNFIPCRQHWKERYRVIGQIMDRFQRGHRHLGLRQSQRRPAGSDT